MCEVSLIRYLNLFYFTQNKGFLRLTFWPGGPSGPCEWKKDTKKSGSGRKRETKRVLVRWNNIFPHATTDTTDRLVAAFHKVSTHPSGGTESQSCFALLTKPFFDELPRKQESLMRPRRTKTFNGFMFVFLRFSDCKTVLFGCLDICGPNTHRRVHYLNGSIVGRPWKSNKVGQDGRRIL